MVVREGVRSDPSVDSGSEAYREMQMLEAIADRGLAMPRSSEMGSSNRVSPSGVQGVDIRVGIPLAVRNTLTELKLIELRRDYCVPPYVVLRLPTAADVGTFGWVQANCRKAKERGYFIGHKPSTQKSWRNRWCMASGYWECPPRKTVSRHVPTHFQSIGSVKWGPISKEQEDEVERVRSSLSETERERKNLVTQENLYESGLLQGSKYPGTVVVCLIIPFEVVPPKLPFGMDDVYAEGVEKMDFSELRRQKKEVKLAMHRQEQNDNHVIDENEPESGVSLNICRKAESTRVG
ncbi:unnamed protein product [Prunus brigantina]